jgi:hypothetical protein
MHASAALVLVWGLLIAGEAVALWLGMHIFSTQPNPWISLKNDALLLVDMATGVALVSQWRLPGIAVTCGLAGIALFAHGYRAWEYCAKDRRAFCVNAPLFLFNNVKLAGLLGILLILGTSWNSVATAAQLPHG